MEPHSALAIVELLERVLLQLPMQDLFRCHSVCRHWKNVTDQTPSLQRALWMAPPLPGPLEIEKLYKTKQPEDTSAPIYQQLLLQYPSLQTSAHCPGFLVKRLIVATINPMLQMTLHKGEIYASLSTGYTGPPLYTESVVASRSGGSRRDRMSMYMRLSKTGLVLDCAPLLSGHISPGLSPLNPSATLIYSPRRPLEGIWMNMLLSNPPPKCVRLYMTSAFGDRYIYNKSGVTAGDIVRNLSSYAPVQTPCFTAIECELEFCDLPPPYGEPPDYCVRLGSGLTASECLVSNFW